jgi:hypothetical protein
MDHAYKKMKNHTFLLNKFMRQKKMGKEKNISIDLFNNMEDKNMK